MEAKCSEQNGPGLLDVPARPAGKTAGWLKREVMFPATPKDVYDIRPREDGDGFDLISDRLQRGPIWYAGPDAVRNAVAYAKYRSRSCSHRAVIRLLDQSGSVIETH